VAKTSVAKKPASKKPSIRARSSKVARTPVRAGKAAKVEVRKARPTLETKVNGKKAAVPTVKSRISKSEERAKSAAVDLRPPVPIPQPIPLDGKPRKNQAGLSSKEVSYFRDMLLAKRRELVGDMSQMEREALRSATTNLSNLPMHMADQGTDNYEQEFTLGLVEKDRQLLREINRALAKTYDGTYGLCEGTGKPILKARLEFQPWAKYSIEYARQLEKGLGAGMRR
jgi:RNA polymerase-binding protein DksA